MSTFKINIRNIPHNKNLFNWKIKLKIKMTYLKNSRGKRIQAIHSYTDKYIKKSPTTVVNTEIEI